MVSSSVIGLQAAAGEVVHSSSHFGVEAAEPQIIGQKSIDPSPTEYIKPRKFRRIYRGPKEADQLES